MGGKVDGQNLAGTRSEKPKILSGTRDEKQKKLSGTKLHFRKKVPGSQRVKLHTDKTDFILFGTRQQIEKANFHSVQLSGIDVHLSTTVTCLGVLIDSELTFSAHIKHLTGRCFYQLCQLRTVRCTLSVEAAGTLVHTFVIDRTDYCNSIFGSTSAVHLRPLQCILNAAACLVVKRRKIDRITDSLRDELHWLPVQYRHTYKICLLVYKCLPGTASSYLIEQCIPVAVNPARSSLWSVSNHDLMYLRTNLVCYSQRNFSVIGS